MLWTHLGNTSALGPYTVQSGSPHVVFCRDEWLGDYSTREAAEARVFDDVEAVRAGHLKRLGVM